MEGINRPEHQIPPVDLQGLFDPESVAKLEDDALAENLGLFSSTMNPEAVNHEDATNTFLSMQQGIEAGKATEEDLSTFVEYVNRTMEPFGMELLRKENEV